ncbi:hypothetical protein PINS_up002115 [Pythium insidiosum]|nr:hypothetical protein PINS_up002115 [Pythium insidiosum]
MPHPRRAWSSLVAALRDPARSDFAFVPHQYVFAAPPPVAESAPTPCETTPINGGLATPLPWQHNDDDDDDGGDVDGYDRGDATAYNTRRKAQRRSWICSWWWWFCCCCCCCGGNRRAAFGRQANAFYTLHLAAVGVAAVSCAWLALFPVSPTRLYNMQVDVFNTHHAHTVFFDEQCLQLGIIFGAALAGYLGDRLGRAGALELASVPYVIGWLLVGLAYGELTVLIGRYMLGSAVGLMSVAAPIYLAEVNAVSSRGRALCVYALFSALGYAVYVAMGVSVSYLSRHYPGFNLGEWKALALAGMLPGIVLLLLVQRLPDSPTWLIIQHDDRETAFAVLEQLFSGNFKHAEREVNALIPRRHPLARGPHAPRRVLPPAAAVPRALLAACGLRAIARADAHVHRWPQLRRHGLGRQPRHQRPRDAAGVVGTVCCFVVIDSRGRVAALQTGCLIALVGCALNLLTMVAVRDSATVLQVTDMGLATVLLIKAGHHLGLAVTPLVLASELFPARQRIGAMSLVLITEAASRLAASYALEWLRLRVAMDAAFVVSVSTVLVCNVVGALLALFSLPETSQRSLQSIEAILSGWYPETPQMNQSRVRLGRGSASLYGAA